MLAHWDMVIGSQQLKRISLLRWWCGCFKHAVIAQIFMMGIAMVGAIRVSYRTTRDDMNKVVNSGEVHAMNITAAIAAAGTYLGKLKVLRFGESPISIKHRQHKFSIQNASWHSLGEGRFLCHSKQELQIGGRQSLLGGCQSTFWRMPICILELRWSWRCSQKRGLPKKGVLEVPATYTPSIKQLFQDLSAQSNPEHQALLLTGLTRVNFLRIVLLPTPRHRKNRREVGKTFVKRKIILIFCLCLSNFWISAFLFLFCACQTRSQLKHKPVQRCTRFSLSGCAHMRGAGMRMSEYCAARISTKLLASVVQDLPMVPANLKQDRSMPTMKHKLACANFSVGHSN